MLQDYEFYFVEGGDEPDVSNSIATNEKFDIKKGELWKHSLDPKLIEAKDFYQFILLLLLLRYILPVI